MRGYYRLPLRLNPGNDTEKRLDSGLNGQFTPILSTGVEGDGAEWWRWI